MKPYARRLVAACAALAPVACSGVAVMACAAGTSNTFTGTATHGSTSTSTSTSSGVGGGAGITTSSGGGSFPVGSGPSSSSGQGVGGGGATYAYAHTNTELYQFDPTASTINMTLVGTFDCIGSGSGTGSSSGGPPTSCSQFGSGGCCIGNTNYYCSSSNAVKTETCKSGETCTWNASKSYYGCGSGSQKEAPGDSPPIACMTGSASTGSGGTQDSSMTDIAVDKDGNLWGVSAHNAYQLSLPAAGSTVVHCERTISLQNVPATFYALSFVPAGVIDANAETLLAGDTAGDLWRIDQTTGALEQHGNFGVVPATDGHGHTYPSDTTVTGTVGTAWQLSGDIVFLDGTPPVGFATVRDCNTSGCSASDTLIQIDTTKLGAAGTAVTGNVTLGLRGLISKPTGCSDTTNATYGRMYGIAAYGSKIYGFSHDGYIVDISNVDGSACAVSGTLTNEAWAGAAVTTRASVVPPPPPVIQ